MNDIEKYKEQISNALSELKFGMNLVKENFDINGESDAGKKVVNFRIKLSI
jgi:hypothetical protein